MGRQRLAFIADNRLPSFWHIELGIELCLEVWLVETGENGTDAIGGKASEQIVAVSF